MLMSDMKDEKQTMLSMEKATEVISLPSFRINGATCVKVCVLRAAGKPGS